MEIYHNPRCRKSREALSYLSDNGDDPKIKLYLETGLTKKEIKDLLKKLNLKAIDIIRKEEAIFKEKFKGKELKESEWIDALASHPKLLQRPIVVSGKEAAIGRPLENIIEMLGR